MKIEVNLDNLTIGDLETLERAGQGDLPMSELIDLLDRVVEGDVRGLPLPSMGEIVQRLNDAVEEMSNPEIAGKN